MKVKRRKNKVLIPTGWRKVNAGLVQTGDMWIEFVSTQTWVHAYSTVGTRVSDYLMVIRVVH